MKLSKDDLAIIEKMRTLADVDNMPPTPVDVKKYGDERCKKCGRHIANELAWKEVKGGDGSNLCWGNCEFEDFDISFTVEDIQKVVKILDRCTHNGDLR